MASSASLYRRVGPTIRGRSVVPPATEAHASKTLGSHADPSPSTRSCFGGGPGGSRQRCCRRCVCQSGYCAVGPKGRSLCLADLGSSCSTESLLPSPYLLSLRPPPPPPPRGRSAPSPGRASARSADRASTARRSTETIGGSAEGGSRETGDGAANREALAVGMQRGAPDLHGRTPETEGAAPTTFNGNSYIIIAIAYIL